MRACMHACKCVCMFACIYVSVCTYALGHLLRNLIKLNRQSEAWPNLRSISISNRKAGHSNLQSEVWPFQYSSIFRRRGVGTPRAPRCESQSQSALGRWKIGSGYRNSISILELAGLNKYPKRMYVCMHACKHAYMHVCMHVCMEVGR